MNLVFITNAGGEQTITAQNVNDDTVIEYYNPNDEAIDGSIRCNIRGKRKKVEVFYEASIQATEIRDLLNNLAQDLANGIEFFYFGFDTDNMVRMVLDETFYQKTYNNQLGIFIPRIMMTSQELNVEIDLIVRDYRFITEVVTVNLDYGLITEAVTTQEDYGTI